MRQRAQRAGLAARLQLDSAGTSDLHIGEAPDKRSQRVAGQRGYDLSGLRARGVKDSDFVKFDLMLAADLANLAELQRRCPSAHQHKLALMLEVLPAGSEREVPDPWYDGPEGFDLVLNLLEAACDGWIERLRMMTLCRMG